MVPFYFNSQPREGGWKLRHKAPPFLSDFNSQPREGGWVNHDLFIHRQHGFQLTAARRRLDDDYMIWASLKLISTHSRAKAAGGYRAAQRAPLAISTHSRAKAAGTPYVNQAGYFFISTHSRAKAAGHQTYWSTDKNKFISTHSRAKAAGGNPNPNPNDKPISTHSRAKAAGTRENTQ